MDSTLLSSLTGLIGIVGILLLAWLLSNNRRAINWRLVVSGLALQLFLAVFCFKFPLGRALFHVMGQGVETLLNFANAGAAFVFGFLVSQPERLNAVFGAGSGFIFAFKLIPTIIFVATLVSMAYHLGIMQHVVRWCARIIHFIMGASGSEALSNAASVFVGQIEAQLLIKPYLSTMTRSELLAVMSGSMACISGGVMAIYIQMGVPAEFLMAASVMAVPGALVISKLLLPETQASLTKGTVTLEVPRTTVNLIDAAARGASEGLKIGLNVCAMLIGFIALIALLDFILGKVGLSLAMLANVMGLDLNKMGLDLTHLSLNSLFGSVFYWVALALGVSPHDAHPVGSLMGTKLAVNEFVAYVRLAPWIAHHTLSAKSLLIASMALCGFANFGSVAMLVGGIGEMAPSRQKELAELGMKALLCGTLASYISAALAGILMGDRLDSALSASPAILMLTTLVIMLFARFLPDGR